MSSGKTEEDSLQLVFDLSYAELDEADQLHFAQLGVFARNEFELDAVQLIWGTGTLDEARCIVEQLVDAGLVEDLDANEWWLHDLLREYARSKLIPRHISWNEARMKHAS